MRVVGADAATYDATLTITAQGRALGRIYHRGVTGLLYAGAMLSGEIVFTAPGVPAWRTPFSVRRQPPLEVTINLGYERPANAPFVEVFTDDSIVTFRRLIDTQPIIEGGRVILPQSPGLGFAYQAETVAKYATQPWATT